MPRLREADLLPARLLQQLYMSTSLVFNTQLKGCTDKENRPASLDAVSHHVQAAMQAIRDNPCGDMKYEKHVGTIYHHLYEAMNLLVAGPPRAPSALDNDLAAVMGGDADGLSEVPELPRTPTTTE